MSIAVTGAINSPATKAKIVIWPMILPNEISRLFNVGGILRRARSDVDVSSILGGPADRDYSSPQPRIPYPVGLMTLAGGIAWAAGLLGQPRGTMFFWRIIQCGSGWCCRPWKELFLKSTL